MSHRTPRPRLGALVFLTTLLAVGAPGGLGIALAPPPAADSDAGTLAGALVRAGGNRAELERALAMLAGEERESLEFLIVNMPDGDLAGLSADFLVENVRLAHDVLGKVPWGAALPREVFLNEVLPYANLNERRDRWRARLVELCLPIVSGCRTAAEAAQRLNETLFDTLGVRYSTRRRRADQGPFETMESGLASCTGLSILLVDACRAVGVPARVAGTPRWTTKRGNHTWVEVWNVGWHFTGAAEPDPRGLDHAWFGGDAAQAIADSPEHAIYAASFRRTDLHFPMVWARRNTDVSAVNVTARYAKGSPEPGIAAARLSLRHELARYFAASPEERAGFAFDAAHEALLAADEEAVRALAWEAYRAAPIHAEARREFESGRVRWEEHESPYTVKRIGERPPEGWALFIAMHGGGGVPKEVNDRQWRVMQSYYRDQDDVPGYVYLALRAPNDRWNGFYDDYVYPLVTRLVRHFLLFGDVDPDKVFLMGYSHGGYGAFAIGPKVPHRFAAVHSSAAAPTDGESSAKTLRNTVFTFMIGENDLRYGRLERCRAFDAEIRELRGDRADIYPVTMELKEGHGHGGLPDRDKIAEMYPAVRNPAPRELTWEMTDAVVTDFFWLEAPRPAKGREIRARCEDNRVEIDLVGVDEVIVGLDRRLADLERPVVVRLGTESRECTPRPSLRVLCESLLARGDPQLAYTARLRFRRF